MGFKYDINRYLASHGSDVPVKNLTEIVKSNRFHPSVQRRLEQAERGPENGPETAACTAEQEYRDKLAKAGFEAIGVEPTRVYRVEDARAFLAAQGIAADSIAPQVDGKFMSAFVRAVKPGRRCCG